MKSIRFTLMFLLVVGLATLVKAQDEQAEQMKVWMEYMTPGPVHQNMAKMVGEWTSDNKMWMAPGTEPIINQGRAKFEMLLGGRYLKSTNYGDFMGMPFEGISIEAYDNATKQFSSIWIDNFGTGMMILKGKWDEGTNTVTYTGKMVDPMQGKEVDVREVFTFKDDNTFVMEMYNNMDGKEFKSMEIVYKRKM